MHRNVMHGLLPYLQYLTGLEDNLHEFNEMNRKLQEENELLKKKLKSLQDEVM